MSELPIYSRKCDEELAALRAECDALQAQVEQLNFTASVLRLSREHAQRTLVAFRASMLALADEWEGHALANEQCGYPDEARIKAYRYCAATLRKLGEGNGRD